MLTCGNGVERDLDPFQVGVVKLPNAICPNHKQHPGNALSTAAGACLWQVSLLLPGCLTVQVTRRVKTQALL